MPAILSDNLGVDRGLICGFRLRAESSPQEISVEDIGSALLQTETVPAQLPILRKSRRCGVSRAGSC